MNMTPVTMVGTVVRDLKGRRVGPDNALVVNFRIVANERRYDRESGTWVNGDSLFMEVTCWRRLAENAMASLLAKGDPVVVSGKLRTREYETKGGEFRSVTELEATAIGPDLARCTTVLSRLRRPEPAPELVAEPDTETGSAAPPERAAAATGPLVPVPA